MISYDGVLSTDGKEIFPCCEHMHRLVYTNVVKSLKRKNESYVVYHFGDRDNVVMQKCPFCSAAVEVVE